MNSFAPFVLSPFVPFAVNQQSPLSTLDDLGIGLFGQGTLVLSEKVDVTAGLRFDHEQKEGVLTTSFSPQIAAADQRVGGEGLLERLAAGFGGLSAGRPRHRVRRHLARLQGRRLQPRVARRAARSTIRSSPGTWRAA